MTTIALNVVPLASSAAGKVRELLRELRDAVDSFAVYRMQHAVPEHELRRADHEIHRYRSMMNASCRGR